MILSQRSYLCILILSVFLGLAGSSPGTARAAPIAQADPTATDSPAATLDTPTVIADEPVDEFAIHAGEAYWINNCFIIPLQGTRSAQEVTTLRRKPVAGGATTTLLSDAQCSQLSSLIVDDADVIYFNSGLNRIERIPLDNPNTTPISITTASQVDNVIADADFVYFTESGNKIFRAPRSGGATETLYDTNFFIGDLVVDNEKIYWFDNGGLWSADKTCDTLPCTNKQNFLANNGYRMQIGPPVFFGDPPTIYAIQGRSINGLRCRVSDGLCPFDNYYTAAAGTAIGDYRFVTTRAPGPLPILSNTLFWTETDGSSNTGRVLRRAAGSTNTPDELFPTDAALLPQIAADNTGIYFSDSRQLLKLPFNASAITRDLAADSMEVTQAIQNLANQAPLIADKPAYVRLYGKSISGPRAGGVEAQLAGTRNGQPLPGSPLQPINGGHALDSSVPFNRDDLRDSWLFKLPASWTSGGITLNGVIDPRTRYADTDTSNNVLTSSFSFSDEPNSCLFFSPVRTHNPIPKVGDPNFWATMARFTRLWPKASTDVRWMGEPIEELEFCSKWGIPYPCWGPYELDQGSSLTNFPSDKDRVIIKLILRQAEARILSLPPASMCEFGGSVHSVGLVHPQADTTAGNFTTNGYANLFFNASWYKMEPFDSTPSFPVWNWPPAANVLAQEVTHNFWRNHIDCGHPEGIDNGWPYNKPCQLNDGGQSNYYGFDPASQSVIPPEIASDYMSYEPSRSEAPNWQGHWVSDYTYKAVKDDAHILGLTSAAAPQTPNLAAAADMVYISGAADPHEELGYLEYAYVQPTAALSAGALQVWQDYAAPDLLAAQAAGAPLAATQPFTFHLRLKDSAGTVLADHAVSLLEPDQHGSDPAASPFLVTFPAPDGIVTRVELLDNEQLLDSLDIGPGQPTVQILSPSAGDTISDSLTIRWIGADPDPGDVLHYNIDYSPDDGLSWLPLANDNPGTPGEEFSELTLSTPQALPGSNGQQARIRVMASDGFHTTSAEVGTFTVNNRSPQPAIVSPDPAVSVPAGDVAVLSGAAYDAEDGSLHGDALSWQVDGAAVGTGEDVIVPGLRPGLHPVMLTATDSDAQQGATQSTFLVDPLALTLATTAPTLDGGCDDGAYAAGKTLALAPYGDGAQASVTLLWQGDNLWACFSGLEQGGSDLVGQVALYADVDHSADEFAQSDDVGFLVGEDGGAVTTVGDGSGGYAGVGPGGLAARVSASGALWQAELQIALSSLGGPGHVLGLAFGHGNVDAADDAFAWPYAAQSGQPVTWAETILGEWPHLTMVTPISTTVGAPVVLTLIGERFAPTATVMLDGAPLVTTVISPTEISANLGASFVGAAGQPKLTVVNPGLADAPSNELDFTTLNKAPTITAISPQNAQEDGAEFKLTVQGNNFAPGAIIRWNDQALPTTAVGGALQATVPADLLTIVGSVTVVVENPTPASSQSNGAVFTIESTFRQLLPLVAK